MDNKERIIEECRILEVGDKMSTIKTKKRSLNKLDVYKNSMYIKLKAIFMMRIYIYSNKIQVNKIGKAD